MSRSPDGPGAPDRRHDEFVEYESALKRHVRAATKSADGFQLRATTLAERVRARMVADRLNEAWLALTGKLPDEE